VSASEFVAAVLLYVAPLYLANSCAMLFHGKTPLDFGKRFFDGRPLLGKGKTFKGAVMGVSIGFLVAIAISLFFGSQISWFYSDYAFFGLVISAGGIIGDVVKSFFKRRLGFEQGSQLFLIDQLDFVVGGLLFSWFLRVPSVSEIAVILVLTVFMHKAANYFAFKIRLKRVPW